MPSDEESEDGGKPPPKKRQYAAAAAAPPSPPRRPLDARFNTAAYTVLFVHPERDFQPHEFGGSGGGGGGGASGGGGGGGGDSRPALLKKIRAIYTRKDQHQQWKVRPPPTHTHTPKPLHPSPGPLPPLALNRPRFPIPIYPTECGRFDRAHRQG